KPARKLAIAAATAVVFGGLLIYVAETQWVLHPGFGPIGTAVLAVTIAAGTTAIMAGWRNHKARYTALTTAAIGIILYFPLQALFDNDSMGIKLLFLLALAAIIVGVIV